MKSKHDKSEEEIDDEYDKKDYYPWRVRSRRMGREVMGMGK